MNNITSKKKSDIDTNKANNLFLKTFIGTFTAVFIAELGDKTQVATLLLTAETGSPITVFIAASSALVLSSLLGVLLGKYISSKISQITFYKTAGSIMILISLYILFNITKGSIPNLLL